MRLTKFTDLALRSVMRLAVSDDGDPLTTREVAEAMDVRYTHVAKATRSSAAATASGSSTMIP
ncbi:hypothetical protein AB0E79_36355, partial [Streptomyces sp. NPDC029004]